MGVTRANRYGNTDGGQTEGRTKEEICKANGQFVTEAGLRDQSKVVKIKGCI